MLELFRVSNYRSLMNIEFRPTALNLLIGPNNAGKTNLCQALRLLGYTSRATLDQAIVHCGGDPWNIRNVYFDSDIVEFEVLCSLGAGEACVSLRYELALRVRPSTGQMNVFQTTEVQSERLTATGGSLADVTLLENEGGKTKVYNEARLQSVAPYGQEYFETTAPTDRTMLSLLFDSPENPTASRFKRYLESWWYYNLHPDRMRLSEARPMDRVLLPDGSNLSSVLFNMHNQRPQDERALIEMIRMVEPRLEVLSFGVPNLENVFMFLHDSERHMFSVRDVSDGTLRFMALCYLINSTQAGGVLPFQPLVMIEEPENGLYVGLLKRLFERLDPSGGSSQFIFTSHNPYFIDLFDAWPDGLHVLKYADKHTVIRKPDIEILRKRLEEFPLGEMHYRELLG